MQRVTGPLAQQLAPRRPMAALVLLLHAGVMLALLRGLGTSPRAPHGAPERAASSVVQVQLLHAANLEQREQPALPPTPHTIHSRNTLRSSHSAPVAATGQLQPREPDATPAAAAPTRVADAAQVSAAAMTPANLANSAAATPDPTPKPAATVAARLQPARPDHDHCPTAPYPALLRERGIEGVVRVQVRVNALGRAAEARVVGASGWRLFDEAAVQRALACRFVPARQGDEAVEGWVDFPVRFALVG